MIPVDLDNFPSIPKPTQAEQQLIDTINKNWDRHRALYELKTGLQTVIEIELSTIPIYLYTYYSINRTHGAGKPGKFPYSEVTRFADQAGAIIMSIAVEEMLHMSLASNILYSLGHQPQLYMRSPSPFPTNLPGHNRLGPDRKVMSLPLRKFSFSQLWSFLEVEYPAYADAPPEGYHWQTIGQIYSYVRSIIFSNHIEDKDFQKGETGHQIQPSNYSPSNIDTIYPDKSFNYNHPLPASDPNSTAHVARYANQDNKFVLSTIQSCCDALRAIATINDQGEGFSPASTDEDTRYDDPSRHEKSHYFKFLKLQSHFEEYNQNQERLPQYPKPPAPASQQFSRDDIATFVHNFPDNPVAAGYPDGWREVANLVNGLYQYMLIMTETIFRHKPESQTGYFNRSLHYSMIWILDKIIPAMRSLPSIAGNSIVPAPTFENIDLGPRDQAFSTLKTMCNDLNQKFSNENWYLNSNLQSIVTMVPTLPDVSALWYTGIPKFPANPPTDEQLHPGEMRHACMGLNSCKGQGRTRDNACAGQGYCSTAAAHNYGFRQSGQSSSTATDHQCRVLNACANQGGCGLYGTAEQQNRPGFNDCHTRGSCATPINAERFSTDGPNRGNSVWQRARAIFEKEVWPNLREKNTALPINPPYPEPANLFKYGPTVEWIQESGQGMTACGSSGMSGAGSCAY